jgi:hypothetical protein
MGATGLGSRLKAQLIKFSLAVSEGLTRPQRKFVHQMLYGIQATQDVKLSSISRTSAVKRDIGAVSEAKAFLCNAGSPAAQNSDE